MTVIAAPACHCSRYRATHKQAGTHKLAQRRICVGIVFMDVTELCLCMQKSRSMFMSLQNLEGRTDILVDVCEQPFPTKEPIFTLVMPEIKTTTLSFLSISYLDNRSVLSFLRNIFILAFYLKDILFHIKSPYWSLQDSNSSKRSRYGSPRLQESKVESLTRL